MTHLILKKKNEVYVTVESEQHVYHELSDHFTFEVDDTFFEKRDYSILKQGNVCINVAFTLDRAANAQEQ